MYKSATTAEKNNKYMGLDMYLKASKYVSGYNFDTKQEQRNYRSILRNSGLTREDADANSPSLEVRINVGYWRKANSIHNWFVENVQDGVDECQESYVSREKLQELKDACNEVIKDNNKAAELLPTKSGFFFGSTDMDSGYILDLEQTVAIIDKCLSDKFNGCDFYYRSSW